MKNTIIFALAFFLFAAVCLAQPTIEWQKCLGGSDDDEAHSIQQTSDGGYIVAGYSWSNDGDVSGWHDCRDYWVVKLNSSGDIECQKCLGGSDYDEAYSIQQTSDGGYIVAGYSSSNDGDVSGWHEGYDSDGNPTYDYWVVKLNSVDDIVWQKCLGGSDYDKAHSIQQTSDGGFIVAGYSSSNDGDISGHHGSTGYPYYDYWIVKLSSSGDIEWQRSLGGSARDEAYSVQQTSDGGFIVAGYSYSNDGDVSGNHGMPGSPDYWVVKLNSTGDIVWQKCLGGSGYDEAASIQQTSDGGFIVAGYSYSNDGDVSGNHGRGDYWVVKLDSAGTIVWQRSLGGSDEDWAASIQQTSDGGFIVAGWSDSNDGDVSGHHGMMDYWVVKLNAAGDIVCQKSLGGSANDDATSIQQTSDGGFIVAGYSYSNDGDVSGYNDWGDYWVVKLSPEEGISDDNNGLQPLAYTISAYPNPFNSSCAITLSGINKGACSLVDGTVEIYDLRGNVVATPYSLRLSVPLNKGDRNRASAKVSGGSDQGVYIWHPDKSTPSGIYLIKATIGDRIITKRAVLLK